MESSNAKQTLLWLWIIAAILIIVCLLFWGQGYASDDNFYNDLDENERSFVLEMEEQYFGEDNIKPLRFRGDTRVHRDEMIKGAIEVIKGTLVLEGEVEGNVLVIFGDIELEPTALVRGDVISVEGVIWTKSGSQVYGDIIETGNSYKKRYKEYQTSKEEKRSYIEKRTDRYESKSAKSYRYSYGYFRKETDREPVFASYNRVDGFTIGLQFPGAGWWERNHHQFAILGRGGYSFASKKSQFQIGLEKWLFEDRGFALGAEYHDMTDTEDRWILSEMENSLAAGLVKEDFYDYYNRKGYSAYFSQYINRYLFIKAEYKDDDFSNLENTTKWAVFGKNKEFRANPAALPLGLVEQQIAAALPGIDVEPYLNLKSIAGTVQLDTRDRYSKPGQGWFITAFGERVGMDEECDMEFERYILDIRRYQPLGWDESFNFRLRGGTARGDMPPMYWFDLGGISTLHGYKFKEFTGDRMVLANIEYRLGTSSSDWFFLDDFDVILFMDSGYAWFADEETPERVNAWCQEEPDSDPLDNDPKASFENLTWTSLKTNFGVALASSDDDFRINFARRTDIGGKDFIVTFRLQHTF